MSRQRSHRNRTAIQLVVVGKIRAPLAAASEEYERRISERCAIRVDEVPHGQGAAREATRREAGMIRGALLDRAHVVCLDPAGRGYGSSEDFTGWLAARLEVPVPTAFLIGGPDGFDDELLHESDEKRSLGSLTFPHQLARVVLLEQIYRAVLAREGHPYPR
jgi:23S rRNA (pseudouridine1915-N3)-methyltransferase